MNYLKSLFVLATVVTVMLFVACDENGDLLIFSVNDDLELGAQVAAEIEANPDQFPILNRTQNADAYEILDDMLAQILDSDAVTYKEEFAWELHIIDDDQTLNAFATPGGYLYVYTGLIFFLDRVDDLAGVIGHEVAHSDQRHSSKQLQREYGISLLLQVITGGQSDLTQEVLGGLVGVGALEFSRDAETEADEFSVEYLSDTEYACNGAASFFEKLLASQESRSPEFLSTHPDPGNRVSNINTKASDINCSSDSADEDGSRMDALQALLRN